tara:strand:+ start:3722 stop:4630 length:909 start_codon:yes stop_codon:yes gene_type:complete
MHLDDLKGFSKNIEGDLIFDFDIKKFSWFNIGGKSKIFFKPYNLKELKDFLVLYNERGKIFILGAGSNVLFKDEVYEGVIIKLGINFSNISILEDNKLIAGAACYQRRLSEFAKDNSLSGLEFMSCIPGTIGGGIRMNSGCFGKEFKDSILSVQVIDYKGNIKSILSNKIKFNYRDTDLDKNIIFLSATFKTMKGEKKIIYKLMSELKYKKNISQPSKIKTGGSTFKNPKNQTDKKVWELIKSSVPENISFGDAVISEKHSNFFQNKKNASYSDMNCLIEYVKNRVKNNTGIDLSLEIVIVD